MSKRWFVIQVYSGSELQVKHFMLNSISALPSEEASKFGDIIVPTEKVIEMKSGQKRKGERLFFPGYVLIELELDATCWHFICKIPKVIGFVGGTRDKPIPISDKDAENIKNLVAQAEESKPKPKVLFEPEELIRVTDGPFAGFNGTVEEVNYEKNRLKVAVLIFGRATPVNLDFSQVEKS